MVFKRQRAPESSGALVGDGCAPPCFWFSRSGAQECADAGPGTPCKHFPFSSSRLLLTSGPHQDCFPWWTPSGPPVFNTVLETFLFPNFGNFTKCCIYLQWQENFFFWSQVCFLGLLKTLKSTHFSNITHFPCFFPMLPFPGIWRPSLLWISCRWKHLPATLCLGLIAEPANFLTFPLCTSFLMGQESLLIAATISNSNNCHDWSGRQGNTDK